MQPSLLQDLLIKTEKRYQAKLRAAYPKLSSTQILALYGILHGLAMAPFLTDEAVREVVRAMKRQWSI